MINEILIEDIIKSFGSDHRQVNIAIEQCRAKGVLTKHEVLQLDNQRLPVSMVLRAILSIPKDTSIDVVLAENKITYNDLMCVIGIIAQDINMRIRSRY